MYNRLLGVGEYIFEEKRSKFIGMCCPAATEEEARQILESIRAAHRTATHHVYAYVLAENQRTRYSDDGEPQGTAGLAVLSVFQGQKILDFICVVTRYFGGTLLGSGGLVRAYTKAAQGALAAAGFTRRVMYATYQVACDYAHLAMMKYLFEKLGIDIVEMAYSERCAAEVRVPEESLEAFLESGYAI